MFTGHLILGLARRISRRIEAGSRSGAVVGALTGSAVALLCGFGVLVYVNSDPAHPWTHDWTIAELLELIRTHWAYGIGPALFGAIAGATIGAGKPRASQPLSPLAPDSPSTSMRF